MQKRPSSKRRRGEGAEPAAAASAPHSAGQSAASERDETVGLLEAELKCSICIGLLCRPHVLPCGHAFCGSCIFDHMHLTTTDEATCPSCRHPLPKAPPICSPQLNTYIDRLRESLVEVSGESLEEFKARRAEWDSRAAAAKEQWSAHARNGSEPPEDDDGGANPFRRFIRQQRPGSDPESLHLRVVNHTLSGVPEVYFRLLPTTPLSRLANAFCERQGLELARVCFEFRGSRIEGDHTPATLGMEDGDFLDARLLPYFLRRRAPAAPP